MGVPRLLTLSFGDRFTTTLPTNNIRAFILRYEQVQVNSPLNHLKHGHYDFYSSDFQF